MTRSQRSPGARKRRGIVWKVLIALTVLCVVAYIITYDPSTVGYWRSDEGRRAYEAAYAEAMAAMPPPTDRYDIPTSYGTVRVYHWANEENADATPALFLPGRSSGVPMWSANLPAVAGSRPVYAMDALGDTGLSVQTAPIEDGADQAAWVDGVPTTESVASAPSADNSEGIVAVVSHRCVPNQSGTSVPCGRSGAVVYWCRPGGRNETGCQVLTPYEVSPHAAAKR